MNAPIRKRNPVTAFAESRLQESIVRFLRLALPSDCMCFAIPNGGYQMPAKTVARLKREGLTSGVPDLAIVRAGSSVAFLEVKTDAGRLSPEQVAFSDWCAANGIEYAVVRSIEDVQETLAVWNVQLRARAA